MWWNVKRTSCRWSRMQHHADEKTQQVEHRLLRCSHPHFYHQRCNNESKKVAKWWKKKNQSKRKSFWVPKRRTAPRSALTLLDQIQKQANSPWAPHLQVRHLRKLPRTGRAATCPASNLQANVSWVFLHPPFCRLVHIFRVSPLLDFHVCSRNFTSKVGKKKIYMDC